MVEKGIREGTCHSICQYAKANNKYMKDFDKNKESPYFQLGCKQFIWLENVAKASSK